MSLEQSLWIELRGEECIRLSDIHTFYIAPTRCNNLPWEIGILTKRDNRFTHSIYKTEGEARDVYTTLKSRLLDEGVKIIE